MAYKVFEDYTNNYSTSEQSSDNTQRISLSDNQQNVQLPDSSYIKDADLSRDGMDLVLETEDGTIIIEGYYTSETPPNLVAPDGTMLTNDLVDAFTGGGNEYANAGFSTNDASPVGAIQEISGEAIIIRNDGTQETVGIGTPVYQGDVIETDEDGAVNIMFIDETTFAVSEDARLSIDEYVFDPATQSGVSNFSVLKGVFVFTSGLIGRDDPDDVTIDTPSGSIGIRGTIIAGDVDTGEITVIEGAIVLSDYAGNSITLANQYETARFDPSSNEIEHIGQLEANDIASKFMSISTVAADLFSSIEDSASETGQNNNEAQSQADDTEQSNDAAEAAEEQQEETQSDNTTVETQEEQAPEDVPQQDTEDNIETNETQSEESTPENTAEETTTEDPSSNEINAESNDDTSAASNNEDIINSTDISENGTNNTPVQQQTPPQPTQDTAESGNETPSPDIATPQPTPVTPPFGITTTQITATEGTSGANVLQIQGQFTSMTNVQLVGPSQNYYEIVRQDNNTLIIKLQDSITLDAEAPPPPLRYRASNDQGTSNLVQQDAISIQNIDDEATAFSGTMPASFFKGSENSHFEYDFSQDFSDPEGDITGYQVIAPSNPNITGITFDPVTGILEFDIGTVAADIGPIGFTVIALSSSGNVTQGYNFNILDYNSPGNENIFNPGGVYSGNASVVNISADGAYAFTDVDNSVNTVNIGDTNATVKTGDGNDIVNVQAPANTGFEIYGGSGGDQINLMSGNGQAYGEGGNDTFTLQNAQAINHLETLTAGVKIDGGTGHDVIALQNGGNINFGNVNAGLIENIEAINANNGSANTIDLSYNSVIQMTDSDNRLVIDTDTNDTVNFTNTSGNTFFNTGQHTNNGETYDVFTDGNITLLIDTDANVTGI